MSPRSPMPPAHFHPYASQLVCVAPRPASAGLDFTRWSLAAPDGGGVLDDDRPWTVVSPAGTLRLGGSLRRAAPPERGYRPLRGAPGGLAPAGRVRRPVAVTLELLPWSSRWSELGLTAGPLRRRDRWGRAEQAYLRGAEATLARLAEMIEAPPARWLA